MGARLAISFAAGFVSVITPCVLPLVPGYLSAVSSIEASRLGERGVARRVVASSLPFVAGFTVFFVVLGAGAAAIGSVVSGDAQTEVAGFVLVVIGLAFVGLLPVPERILAPGLLGGARRSGSGFLLGGAFAVCAAPCIGTVLAAVLVLASNTGTVVKGAVLLAAYALGLGVPFLITGLALGRVTGALRFVKRHFGALIIGSSIVLAFFGVLLVFDSLSTLTSHLQRALDRAGPEWLVKLG
jgi:cytochrome c-type biogenesis protein